MHDDNIPFSEEARKTVRRDFAELERLYGGGGEKSVWALPWHSAASSPFVRPIETPATPTEPRGPGWDPDWVAPDIGPSFRNPDPETHQAETGNQDRPHQEGTPHQDGPDQNTPTQGIVCSNPVGKGPNIGPDGAVKADSGSANLGATGTQNEPEIGGYLLDRWPGSKAQLEWINGLLAGYTAAQRYLFLHVIINRMIRHASHDPWVPVSFGLMHRDLPDCPRRTEDVWRPLEEAGLIIVEDSYSHMKGESREYTVAAELVHEFLERGIEVGEQRYDLFTGKRDRRKAAHTTKLKDSSEHRYPDLVDKVLRHFKTTRRAFNYRAVEWHVWLRYEAAAEAFRIYEAEGFQLYSDAYRAYQGALGRYETDRFAFEVIKHQDLRHEGGDIYSYQPAYEVQELSGRLTEMGGGLQSCSRAMKAASIEGIGYFNYDIVSSQLYGLRQGFEDAGMDTAPIDHLLAQDKAVIAARLGMSVDTYKSCLYALLFHGSLYRTLEDALRVAETNPRYMRRGDLPSIPKAIMEDQSIDPSAAYRAFSELMWPLYTALKAWHKWLAGPYWKSVRKRSRGYYATNDAGIVIRPTDYKKGHERTSKLAAWYLQGKEAAIVHHLTLLGEKYGYEVVANEHDGVLSSGEIPVAAFEEAHANANFTYAEFEIKPIGETLWNTTTTTTTCPAISTATRSTSTRHGTISPRPGDTTISQISSATKCSSVTDHHCPHTFGDLTIQHEVQEVATAKGT